MKYQDILDTVLSFYKKAVHDFMIGYHFRNIDDFESHIPRIADFWQLQLTGKLDNKGSLPFDLITAHRPLNIKSGEMGRWVVLFDETLKESNLSEEEVNLWKEKIELFKTKLLRGLELSK